MVIERDNSKYQELETCTINPEINIGHGQGDLPMRTLGDF